MTKLTQWLFAATIFLAVWVAALKGYIEVDQKYELIVLGAPVIAVGLFGIVSVLIIAYRVATFNNCDEAAEELKKEIEEAKRDLTSKGFKFDKTK